MRVQSLGAAGDCLNEGTTHRSVIIVAFRGKGQNPSESLVTLERCFFQMKPQRMMKHNQNNNRRNRSRGNGRKYPNQKGGSFDSNGPEAKVRGNAAQVLEKYQALARDANSAGDRILAEGYLQHAEHYYRILNTENENKERGRQDRDNRDANNSDNSAKDGQNNEGRQASSEDGAQGEKPGRRDNSRRRNQKPKETTDNASESPEAEAVKSESVAVVTSEETVEVVAANDEAPKKPRTRKPRKAPTADTETDATDVPQAAD